MSDSESSKEQIVIACQALGLHGCGSGIGGHVSMRAPGENAIWINAFDRTLWRDARLSILCTLKV